MYEILHSILICKNPILHVLHNPYFNNFTNIFIHPCIMKPIKLIWSMHQSLGSFLYYQGTSLKGILLTRPNLHIIHWHFKLPDLLQSLGWSSTSSPSTPSCHLYPLQDSRHQGYMKTSQSNCAIICKMIKGKQCNIITR